MLELRNITKAYNVAGFEQTALNGLSVTFRGNEFAAILGPSGSGKTTLLNIIGGLDHADIGDLMIDGVSTQLYTDRDWDTYRNNRIGFVFQSYNLIPHQTVLSNVELALTLSGVSKSERQSRAKRVLREVGLADHIHKKPSQLSGGQMQRVAIARALVNNPEIVLADEPTGALDSKTSLQIMDLLTRIAKDRLVIMVTHNAELADTYANRTINLSDGQVVSDTNPYWPETDLDNSTEPVRRSSMGLLTSLALSFSNLMTKKGRTIMTAFAGSIGIIGIAAILALANGVNEYIKDVEEGTLSQYPLSVTRSGIDLTSMLFGTTADDGDDPYHGNGRPQGQSDSDENTLREAKMLTGVFKSITTNDLASLKTFLDKDAEPELSKYVNAIEYGYDLTPQIFLGDTSQKVWQVNPDMMSQMMDPSAASMGSSSSAWSFGMNMSVFNPLPQKLSLVEDQYDVLAGHWPESYNECILVLSEGGRITDYLLYTLGLRDPELLQQMFNDFLNQKDVTVPRDTRVYNYQDIMDIDLRLIPSTEYYTYDSVFEIYVDHRDDQNHLKNLVDSAEQMHIVGVIAPKQGSDLSSLRPGICYSPELIDYLITQANTSDIVKNQLADREVDIFTGKTFEQINSERMTDFDMGKMLNIDKDGFGGLFDFGSNPFSGLDLSGSLNMGSMDMSALITSMPNLPAMDLSVVLSSLELSDLPLSGLGSFATAVLNDYLADRLPDAGQEAERLLTGFGTFLQTQDAQAMLAQMLTNAIDVPSLNALAEGVLTEYMRYCGTEGITDPYAMIAGFPAWLESQSPSLTPALTSIINGNAIMTQISNLIGTYLTQAGFAPDNLIGDVFTDFSLWLSQPEVSAKVQGYFSAYIDLSPLLQKISATFGAYLQQTIEGFMVQFMTVLQRQLSSSLTGAMSQMSSTMSAAMGMSPGAFENLFDFNLDQDELAQLMLSMMGTQQKTYEMNLKLLGYADPANPSSVSIYPKDFESKQEVLNILDGYNARMKETGEKDKAIVYTDFVGALMSSVTRIINMISAVLVAFVAISLVVSSIMIGIVTYISVLERKKEIGILRSIGASKFNIFNVFTAETLIIGFAAGMIGLLITMLLCIPANIIVEAMFDVADLAQLPFGPAMLLLAISCILSFIAGLIPSVAAAQRDPVEALRSE
ncbi:MAG: ABC transporter ATP-binding protein/permease [Peptococcaceae bacterium]|nr:ABC transporter ATP-binding protein/permease [Peptococcaceae bacterium]